MVGACHGRANLIERKETRALFDLPAGILSEVGVPAKTARKVLNVELIRSSALGSVRAGTYLMLPYNSLFSNHPTVSSINNLPSTMPPTTGSPTYARVDSAAELKLRVKMAVETMKKAAADGASASRSIPPLSPILSLDTGGTGKTVHFGQVEEIEWRDEIRYIEDEMESSREVEDSNTTPEMPHAQICMSIRTQKTLDFTDNLPTNSNSTSTATTSLCQSVANNNSKISDHSTASFSTDSATSISDDFFALECPVALSYSYSGSMQGLEIVPIDAKLSTSDSLAYNESIEDTGTVVAKKDNQAKLGCLVAMKDLTDDITLAAREVRNFYNSPRKSVTFILSATEICHVSVQDVE